MLFTKRDSIPKLLLFVSQLAPLAFALTISKVTDYRILISWGHVATAYFFGSFITRALPHAGRTGLAANKTSVSRLSLPCSLALLLIPSLLTSTRAYWPILTFTSEYIDLCAVFLISRGSTTSTTLGSADRLSLFVATAPPAMYAGALLFNLFLRAYPAANPAFLLLTFLLSFFCIRVQTNRLFLQEDNPSNILEAKTDDRAKNALPGLDKLTARELSTIELTLQGLTSKECGAQLGIRPSTAREYLRRSYAKLGISSSRELRSVLAESQASLPSQPPSDHNGMASQGLTSLLALVSLVLLISPLGPRLEDWGASSNDVLAIASGLLVASSFQTAQKPASHSKALFARTAIAEVTLLSVALAFSLSSAIDKETASLIRIAARYFLAVHLPSFLNEIRPENRRSSYLPNMDTTAYCFVAGLALEEIWRGFLWLSFLPATLLFLIPFASSVFIVLHRQLTKQARLCVLCLAALFVCCLELGGNQDAGPIAILLFLLAGPFIILTEAGYINPASNRLSLAVSFGLILGTYGVNTFSTAFTYNTGIFGVYGTQTGLEILSISLAAIVYFGSGAYFSYKVIRTSKQCERMALADRLAPSAISQYLASFDLTKTQTEIAVLLVQGLSLKEISERLNYSVITIRAAKNQVLKTFDVGSISELQKGVVAGIQRSQFD